MGGNYVLLGRWIKAAKERKPVCSCCSCLLAAAWLQKKRRKEKKEGGGCEKERLREGRVTVGSAAQLPVFPYKLRNSSGHCQRVTKIPPQ